jgi:hypothetical protein
MTSATRSPSQENRTTVGSPPVSSSSALIGSALEVSKKVFLIGCALLATVGILYLCACDRKGEGWCQLKSNAQILSNMGLIAGFF